MSGPTRVRYTLRVPGSGDRIVLFDESTVSGSNVVRCREDGSIVWQAELPKPDMDDRAPDFYTSVRWDLRLPFFHRLGANSWSCWAVRINPKTGRIVSKVFTK
jgi:hypothetical protein